VGISIENEVDSDFIIYCPFHNNYRTPAAEISKTTGTFFCFSCQESKSIVEFVMFVSNKTYFESVRLIDSYSSELDISIAVDNLLNEVPEYVEFDSNLINQLHSNISQERSTSYLETRKINLNSISNFNLGYSIKQDMITIPIKNPDGSFYVGFVARSIEGKSFMNTPGLPKSKVLFNLHNVRRYNTVYVVESSFDVMRLHQNKVPAVATLGANVSNYQIDLLKKYFNNVVVIGDNDDAGKNMQEKVLDKIGNRATLVSIPSRFKDIGDMEDSDIIELTTRIDDPLLSIY
jgi:DNA primase